MTVVRTEVADRVALVTLDRPEARNALNAELLRAIPEAMARVDADPDVDVIVLTGADPAFCAGIDLKELQATGGDFFRVVRWHKACTCWKVADAAYRKSS